MDMLTDPAQHQIWQSALSGMAEGVLVVNRDGHIVVSNPAAQRILDKAPATDSPAGLLPFARALGGETMSNLELSVGGVWISLNLTPLRDEAGSITGAVAVFRDITEQEELRAFRRAVEQSPSSVVVTDTQGNIEYVNPKFTEVTGYSREEVIGKNPRILKTGSLPREHYERMWRTIASGQEWRGEFLNRKKNGEEYWEDASISPIVGADGTVTHYIGVKHDITERKRMEQALRETNATLRLVIQTSPLAIVTLDPEANVTSWNRAAEAMFGWSEQEVLNRPLPLIPPEKRETLLASLGRAGQEQGMSGLENKYLKKNGRPIEAAVWQSPLRDSGGSVCGVLVVFADIAERKRLEERLRESQKLEAIGTLAGGVAHDFNNLMTVVLGYAQLLAEGLDPRDERFDQVRQIVEASRRVSALTSELLSFSGRQMVRPKILSLNALISGLMKKLRGEAGKRVCVRAVLAPELGAVRVDAEQIGQALLNLAANARDAMPEGGTLTISTANAELTRQDLAARPELQPGRFVMTSVSDTGRGIDEGTRRRLFDPFFTTKPFGSAKGLGLSAVYGTVRQAGGEIRVLSEPGQGTTFQIYLPRVDS